MAKGIEATEDIDANCSYSGLESLGLFLLYGDASALTRPRSLPYKFGFETSYQKLLAPTSIYGQWETQPSISNPFNDYHSLRIFPS